MSEQTRPTIKHFQSHNLTETEEIGKAIASKLSFPSCVYLQGDLGMGKTTLCKSIIEHLGYQEPVTSPTYNLIQEYPVNSGTVFHMDLYRLQEPEELEFLALADLWSSDSLFLIEWAAKGEGYLPESTHVIEFISKNGNRLHRDLKFTIF